VRRHVNLPVHPMRQFSEFCVPDQDNAKDASPASIGPESNRGPQGWPAPKRRRVSNFDQSLPFLSVKLSEIKSRAAELSKHVQHISSRFRLTPQPPSFLPVAQSMSLTTICKEDAIHVSGKLGSGTYGTVYAARISPKIQMQQVSAV
jgi:hypothetical protein